MTSPEPDDTLPGYFIAPDDFGELWVWRENGPRPALVIAKHHLCNDPAVWDILAAAIRTVDA